MDHLYYENTFLVDLLWVGGPMLLLYTRDQNASPIQDEPEIQEERVPCYPLIRTYTQL